MNPIKPASVAGATIIMQFSLLLIIFIGISWHKEDKYKERPIKAKAFALGLFLAIMTILIIGLSQDYFEVWGAMMGDLNVPTINGSIAMTMVFVLDIVVTITLILMTGGTRESPFTSMLFLIPSLAIFLRESPAKFLTYTVVVGVYYWLTCRATYSGLHSLSFDRTDDLAAHRAVNIGCLILATVTGYITRPALGYSQ